jgi:hypothetical protein
VLLGEGGQEIASTFSAFGRARSHRARLPYHGDINTICSNDMKAPLLWKGGHPLLENGEHCEQRESNLKKKMVDEVTTWRITLPRGRSGRGGGGSATRCARGE